MFDELIAALARDIEEWKVDGASGISRTLVRNLAAHLAARGWRRGTDVPRDITPAEWEDHRVQLVYGLLCSEVDPPPECHWEGWLAGQIVAALDAHGRNATPGDPLAGAAPDLLAALEELTREWDTIPDDLLRMEAGRRETAETRGPRRARAMLAARAAIARAKGAPVAWRPMETAPRVSNDRPYAGPYLWLLIPYKPPEPDVGYWSEHTRCWRYLGDDGPDDDEPIGWLPLVMPGAP